MDRNVFNFINNLIGEDSDNNSDIDSENDIVEEEMASDSDQDVDNGQYGEMVARDGRVYQENLVRRRGRRPAANVVRNIEAMIPPTTICDSVSQSFLLYYSPDINNRIVMDTNREARRVLALPETSQYIRDRWYPVTEAEMMAFVGLLLEAGTTRDGGRYLMELYDDARGNALFKATMSAERFKQVLRFLRFDDKATRNQRRQVDKLAAFREVWELFVRNFQLNYVPSAYTTIDEQVVPFRGRAPFKVYMKNKPHK